MVQVVVFRPSPADSTRGLIQAAPKDERDSRANEPGNRRLECPVDTNDWNTVHLSEAKRDLAAFRAHDEGEYVRALRRRDLELANRPISRFRGNHVAEPRVSPL
jgi:quinol monooxygenase YgiN